MDLAREIELFSHVPSVSGHETKAQAHIKKLCDGIFDEVICDRLGSVTAIKHCGIKGAKKLLIDSHIDEIGFMVSEICDGGFLKISPVGGISASILPATEILIHSGKTGDIIRGIIATKPPHLLSEKDREKLVEIKDMYVDTGYSREKIEEIIEVGDIATFDVGSRMLKNGRYSSRALDDRLCALCVIKAVEDLADREAKYDIYAVFSSQEETSSLGAITLARRIEPDLAIAVDVTHAELADSKNHNPIKMSEGVTVSISDTISISFAKYLLRLADEEKIPCIAVAEPSYTGTNAHYIQISNTGIPTALISLPIRYMHTPVETVSLADCESCARLLCTFMADGGFRPEEETIIV